MMNINNDFELSDYESDISADENEDNEDYVSEPELYEEFDYSGEEIEVPVRVITPQPIQLAAANSTFCTLADARTFYQHEHKRKLDELDHEEHMRTVIKRLAEEQYWKEIIDSLPVESEAFKKRRLVQETEEKTKLLEEKKAQETKSLPFGHRRNGGKQKKSHLHVDPAVVKQRRAERRRVRKSEKKEEEIKRVKIFEAQAANEKIEEEKIEEEKIEEEKIEEEKIEEENEEEKIEELVRRATVKLSKPKNSVEDQLLEFGLDKGEKEDTNWTVVSSKKKKEPLVLKMGVKPFRELLKTEPITQTSSGKTRMCRSVVKNQQCAHGEHCRFAHTMDELTPKVCEFGEACKFFHSKDKRCSYIHSFETKMEYCNRLELVPQAPKLVRYNAMIFPEYMVDNQPVPPNSPMMTPVKEKKELVCPGAPEKQPPMTPVKEKKELVCPGAPEKQPPMTPVNEKKELVCLRAPEKQPPIPETTILKVPKVLAMQALEMAMAAGRKNIKIIIV